MPSAPHACTCESGTRRCTIARQIWFLACTRAPTDLMQSLKAFFCWSVGPVLEPGGGCCTGPGRVVGVLALRGGCEAGLPIAELRRPRGQSNCFAHDLISKRFDRQVDTYEPSLLSPALLLTWCVLPALSKILTVTGQSHWLFTTKYGWVPPGHGLLFTDTDGSQDPSWATEGELTRETLISNPIRMRRIFPAPLTRQQSRL